MAPCRAGSARSAGCAKCRVARWQGTCCPALLRLTVRVQPGRAHCAHMYQHVCPCHCRVLLTRRSLTWMLPWQPGCVHSLERSVLGRQLGAGQVLSSSPHPDLGSRCSSQPGLEGNRPASQPELDAGGAQQGCQLEAMPLQPMLTGTENPLPSPHVLQASRDYAGRVLLPRM